MGTPGLDFETRENEMHKCAFMRRRQRTESWPPYAFCFAFPDFFNCSQSFAV